MMAEGFEEIELIAPADILRRLGVSVTLVGVDAPTVRGAHGICLFADRQLENIRAEEYDAVIVPGGGAAWALAKNPRVLQLLRDMHSAQPCKLIAAICAAPMVLAAAGVLSREQQVTCYPSPDVMQAVRATATLVREPVVCGDDLVTGMGPACALDFGFAVGAKLVGAEQVSQLHRDMCATICSETALGGS